MQTDRVSLIELGLLPDATGSWTLASVLDHTHARPAHETLKRLIATPLSGAEAIVARQELLPALAQLAPRVPWRELQALAVQVEQGLGSNFILAPASRVGMVGFAMRHREIVTFAARLATTVHRLLQLARPVGEVLDALNGDAAFVALRSSWQAVFAEPRLSELSEVVANGAERRIATCDAWIRDANATHGVPFRERLQALIDALWQLDAFCSLAIASDRMSGVRPVLVSRDASPRLVGLFHPMLAGGVRNDVVLDTGERVLFVTGPNMAGKSTLLRAFGVAVYFTHLGMRVPAAEATIPCVDRLCVSMTMQDNMARRESLYLAEVRRVKTIVDAVAHGESVVAIVDEVFRGTNVHDAVQATSLLVDGLSRAPRGCFVLASHLSEVAEARRTQRGLACRCMTIEESDGEYCFTFRLVEGVSGVHLGMRLLDAEGVGGVLRGMAAG